jgi:two-component system, NarL family, response regulator NreC
VATLRLLDLAGQAVVRSHPSVFNDELSAREVQVIKLIVLGHTGPEIAVLLHVAVRTVDAHRAHINSKVGSKVRADLVAYACEHGYAKVEV